MKTFKTLTTLALLTLLATNLSAGRVKFDENGKAIISGKHKNIKGCQKNKPCEEEGLLRLKNSLKRDFIECNEIDKTKCSEKGGLK